MNSNINRFLILVFTYVLAMVISPLAIPAYVNITKQAGIDFKHNNGAFGKKYLPETMGAGSAFIDYNRDGWQDIILVNSKDWPGHPTGSNQTMALYRNNGNGSFTDQTQLAKLDIKLYGIGIAVADYDNDGHQDFYLTCLNMDRLFQNQGDGTFIDVTEKSNISNPYFGTSCAWFDYDKDGYLDLYVANYVEWSIETDLFCTLDGTSKSYCTPESYQGQPSKLFKNRGNGTFSDVSRIARIADPTSKSLGVCTFDYDADGFIDVFEANDTQPNKLYRNNGDGTFIERGMLAGIAYNEDGKATGAMGVDAGDYDGSGIESLVIGNFSNEMINLYHNEGDFFIDDAPIANIGTVSLLTLTFGCFFFDFDLDGKLDIFTANGHLENEINLVQSEVTYKQAPHLFRNIGNAKFVDVANQNAELMEPIVGRGAAYGDIDNDGDWDLVVTNCNGHPRLFRNDRKTPHSWIKIKLIGKKSNRDGIGSRVKVTTESGFQLRTLRSGSSYCSQSELSLIFGLGNDRHIRQIDINWPSGLVTSLTEVTLNQSIIIEEN
ncbi:MAG: CRTAC1 family protein [Candidatus Poribacteria bacterium]|nr:CRTAC1 family protein [Candidatus Poribacteria bacterium]